MFDAARSQRVLRYVVTPVDLAPAKLLKNAIRERATCEAVLIF
jgi:hypothetical protein